MPELLDTERAEILDRWVDNTLGLLASRS